MPRVNCFARIERREQQRHAGHRLGAAPASVEILYDGPAHITSPTREWERIAALEGAITAQLHVESGIDLLLANSAVVRDHPAYSGDYEVRGVASSGVGTRYSFVLGKRGTHAAGSG